MGDVINGCVGAIDGFFQRKKKIALTIKRLTSQDITSIMFRNNFERYLRAAVGDATIELSVNLSTPFTESN